MVPKYPKTFHWPWSPVPHRRYMEHPENFVGRRVVVPEKLDGGNTALSEGKVYARSTGQPATEPWFDFVKGNHATRTYGLGDLVPYGENLYAVHSIEYEPLPDFFHLFHVLSTSRNVFLGWDAVKDFAAERGFMHVPVVFDGVFSRVEEITELFQRELPKGSVYGPEREGFVIRIADEIPYDDYAKFASKYVRDGHIKTDEHWTKHWYPAKLKTGG
jgi:hypothetical protein